MENGVVEFLLVQVFPDCIGHTLVVVIVGMQGVVFDIVL